MKTINDKLTGAIVAVLLFVAALLMMGESDNLGAFLAVKGLALGLGFAGVKLYNRMNAAAE